MMASTCLEAENMIDYDSQYDHIRHNMLKHRGDNECMFSVFLNYCGENSQFAFCVFIF